MSASNTTAMSDGPGSHWLVNLAVFQAAWLATALAAAQGQGWVGPLVVTAAIAVNLQSAARPVGEAQLLVIALLIGVVVEQGLLWSGLIRYPGDPAWVPAWMLGLWPLFATTLNGALRWFQNHLSVAALAGSLGGPLAYVGGQALGALALPSPIAAVIALGVIWGIAMPVMSGLSALLAGRQVVEVAP